MNYGNTKPYIFSDFENKRPPTSNNKNREHLEKNYKYCDNSNFSQKSPKSEFNFENKLLNRCNSTSKVKSKQNRVLEIKTRPGYEKNNNESRDLSANSQNHSKVSNGSAITQYLDRRHNETQDKINKLKLESLKKEIGTQNFRPQISENSKKIVNKLINQESVFQMKNVNALPLETKANVYRRNNSFNNKKLNITSRLTNTIEELNDYKRIIEKRENFLKDEPRQVQKPNANSLLNPNSHSPPLAKGQAQAYSNLHPNPHPQAQSHLQAHPQPQAPLKTLTQVKKVETQIIIRKRPSSSNPKQRSDKNINENKMHNLSNLNNLLQYTNEEYKEYDPEKVLDSRYKLNNYYTEKEKNLEKNRDSNRLMLNTTGKVQSQAKGPKKLFALDGEIKNEPLTVQPFKIIEKVKKEKENNKSIPLPSEKPFNANIDFNQLDQFSPPNNGNIDNITYNIQQAYKQMDNNYNNKSDSYNSNLTGGLYNYNLTGGLYKKEENKFREKQKTPVIEKRKDDLDFFKNFADNIKLNYNYNNDAKSKLSNDSYLSDKKSKNNIDDDSSNDLFKLDPGSKSYALEKLREMKSKAENHTINSQRKLNVV